MLDWTGLDWVVSEHVGPSNAEQVQQKAAHGVARDARQAQRGEGRMRGGAAGAKS